MKTQFCYKCGKEFVPAPEHVFVDNGRFFCKWTCYNHRHECEKKRYVRDKVKHVYLCDSNGNVLKSFTSANDASEKTGFDAVCIRRACSEGSVYRGFKWKYKSKEVI